MRASKGLRRWLWVGLLVAFMALAYVPPAVAQDGVPRTVTADDVNAIAQKLYCPVCENIPLDVCGTAACADWRDEIRQQLESGMTEQQIVDDFVRRFGDRVVGTPQDPALRALSLVTPYILIGAGLLLTLGVIWRLQHRKGNGAVPPSPDPADAGRSNSSYYEQLQKDLEGK